MTMRQQKPRNSKGRSANKKRPPVASGGRQQQQHSAISDHHSAIIDLSEKIIPQPVQGVKIIARREARPRNSATLTADEQEPISRLIAKLENVRKTKDDYSARCPGHDDQHNSLSVTVDHENGGCVLICCHAGCSTEKVVQALGMRMSDLFPRQNTAKRPSRRRTLVAQYGYSDKRGSPLISSAPIRPERL